MRWSQHVKVLCSIPAENKTIILAKVLDNARQKNKRICLVIDDKEFAISICIFYCCISREIKIGRKRVIPILSDTKNIRIMITENSRTNPKGKINKKIKIKLIAEKEIKRRKLVA